MFRFIVFLIFIIFSFSCGLNQLFWYYVQIRNKDCDSKVFEDAESKEECYLKIKYFSKYGVVRQTSILLLKMHK